MSHWQLRLQRKLQSEPNGFFKAFLISFFVHVLIFIVPFLFIKQAGIIIIDSSGKYNLPVYYKYSGGSGAALGNGSGSGTGSGKTGSSVSHVRRSFNSGVRDSVKKPVVVKKESRDIDTNSFLKLKKFNKKQALSNKNNKKIKSSKLEKNLSKKQSTRSSRVPDRVYRGMKGKVKKLINKKDINQKKLEQNSVSDLKNRQDKESLKSATISEEKLDEKIRTVENEPEVNPENLKNLNTSESNLSGVAENSGENVVLNSGDSLVISGDGSGDGSGSGMMGGFGIEGYLHSDGELVNNIRNAVGKNWSRPKGFSNEVYCEFKILVSQDGKSVKILEQKNSKVPAFNIQARGAILKTEFPEKCWNKELTLVLR